jgi:hypothetical protein
MSAGTLLIWVAQAMVTWLVYRDLRPQGNRFVAYALGLQSDIWIWTCLFVLAVASMLLNSRIAANAYSTFTGKRPGGDWLGYGRSGASTACYWCGLISFASCLTVQSQTFQLVSMPPVETGIFFLLTLFVSAASTRFVVYILFRRRFGHLLNSSFNSTRTSTPVRDGAPRNSSSTIHLNKSRQPTKGTR